MYNCNYGLKDKIDNLMMLIERFKKKQVLDRTENTKPKLGLPPKVMEGRKKKVIDVHLP